MPTTGDEPPDFLLPASEPPTSSSLGGRRRAPSLDNATDQTVVFSAISGEESTTSPDELTPPHNHEPSTSPGIHDHLLSQPTGIPSGPTPTPGYHQLQQNLPRQHTPNPLAISNALPSQASFPPTPPPALPPTRGWRHWVYSSTKINLGPSRDERYERDLHTRIRRPVRDVYQVGIIGLKGGAGRTVVSMALGSTLSKVRGDRILAIDADPAAGNLGDRCPRQSSATIADLLADPNIVRYSDIRAYTNTNSTNLEVLASPTFSAASRPLDDPDWHRAVEAASRHYNIIVSDCGANLFAPPTRAVLSSGAHLVIVTSASADGVRQVGTTLEWLWHNGYQEAINRACVVINHINRRASNIDIDDVVQRFQQYLPTQRVIALPWDKHIANDIEIQLELIGTTYRRRMTELAAALSDNFSTEP